MKTMLQSSSLFLELPLEHIVCFESLLTQDHTLWDLLFNKFMLYRTVHTDTHDAVVMCARSTASALLTRLLCGELQSGWEQKSKSMGQQRLHYVLFTLYKERMFKNDLLLI